MDDKVKVVLNPNDYYKWSVVLINDGTVIDGFMHLDTAAQFADKINTSRVEIAQE